MCIYLMCARYALSLEHQFLSNQIDSSVLLDSPIDSFNAHVFLRQLLLIFLLINHPFPATTALLFQVLSSRSLDGIGFSAITTQLFFIYVFNIYGFYCSRELSGPLFASFGS